MRRFYRGAWYEIHVTNPEHVCAGIKRICADGREIAGAVLPAAAPGSLMRVEVIMGMEERE